MKLEGVGVEKECELRRSASREGESREGVLVEKVVSREGVQVEKECELRRSASREGVQIEKECE